MPSDDARICVHASWRDWRSAEVSLADLQEVQWLQPLGAPQPLVHGYIDCLDILSGQIPHLCASSPAPHRLLVCVIRKSVLAVHYEQLARRADERRRSMGAGRATHPVAAGRMIARLAVERRTGARVPPPVRKGGR